MAAPTLPFPLRRPWIILRHWLTDRDRPDLEGLRAQTDPERFVWGILPHAARTFAACIALLPSRKARAAAVGYLYCRCLDTYEDLAPEPGPLLDRFAARFDGALPAPAPVLANPRVQDIRDRAHLLLLERIERVDALYLRLPERVRASIARCVRDMAVGMREGKRDVLRYCRAVLGNPVVFGMELLVERDLDARERETAMRVGELVQLANITRDVEKDLARGVQYDPRAAHDPDALRAEWMDVALARAPDYRRLIHMLRRPRVQLGRASALLMLLFTSRYYDGLARRLGRPGWNETRSTLGLLLRTFPATWSYRYALRAALRSLGGDAR